MICSIGVRKADDQSASLVRRLNWLVSCLGVSVTVVVVVVVNCSS